MKTCDQIIHQSAHEARLSEIIKVAEQQGIDSFQAVQDGALTEDLHVNGVKIPIRSFYAKNFEKNHCKECTKMGGKCGIQESDEVKNSLLRQRLNGETK